MKHSPGSTIYLLPVIPNLSILDEWLPIIRHLKQLQPRAVFYSVLDIEWKARQPLDPKYDGVVISEFFLDGCIVRRGSGKTLTYDSLAKAGVAEHLLECRIIAPLGLRAMVRVLLYIIFRLYGSMRTKGRHQIEHSGKVCVLADPSIYSNSVVCDFLRGLGAQQFYLLPHGAGWK